MLEHTSFLHLTNRFFLSLSLGHVFLLVTEGNRARLCGTLPVRRVKVCLGFGNVCFSRTHCRMGSVIGRFSGSQRILPCKLQLVLMTPESTFTLVMVSVGAPK